MRSLNFGRMDSNRTLRIAVAAVVDIDIAVAGSVAAEGRTGVAARVACA